MVPVEERHFWRAVAEFVAHYHRERNHQGLDNELIAGTPARDVAGHVSRRSRLGGLLNYCERPSSRLRRGTLRGPNRALQQPGASKKKLVPPNAFITVTFQAIELSF